MIKKTPFFAALYPSVFKISKNQCFCAAFFRHFMQFLAALYPSIFEISKNQCFCAAKLLIIFHRILQKPPNPHFFDDPRFLGFFIIPAPLFGYPLLKHHQNRAYMYPSMFLGGYPPKKPLFSYKSQA